MSETKGPPRRHPGRKLRNLLLNKELQLRFALFIVFVTTALTAVLIGVTIYETNRSTAHFRAQREEATHSFTKLRKEATDMFARQRQEATNIFKEQLKVATDMLDVMKLGTMAKKDSDKDTEELARDQELRKQVDQTKQAILKQDTKVVEIRKRQDAEAQRLREVEDSKLREQREKEDQALFQKQRKSKMILIIAMLAFSFIFLVVVFLYGIVITHKVAGPLFKIGRHMNEVRENKLSKIYGLRKGDQLVEFFNIFKEMHDALKSRTQNEIKILEQVLPLLAGSDAPAAKQLAADLKKLLEEKQKSVEEES